MPINTLIIRGGSETLTTNYLEAISERILYAKTSGAQMEISLKIFQQLLYEVLRNRREALADSKEIEEIVSSMKTMEEVSGPRLPISESRLVPEFYFDGLEITDLDQLDVGSSPETENEPTVDDEETEIEVVRPPPPRRIVALRSRRKNYWASSLNFTRVLVISLLGFLMLAGLVLLRG